MRMGRKVIASLTGSYQGQSPAGKDNCPGGTGQHPLLFPVHPGAWMHRLWIPGDLLGVEDPKAQSGRRTEGWRKR